VSVGGGYVIKTDAEVTVIDAAVLHQLLGGGADDLRGDGEAGTGKGSAVGDDEGVDSDELAVGVDQSSAGVTGVDGGVGLDEAAGFTGVVGVGVGTIDGADDAAGDGELEVAEGASEGEDGLAGLQLAGVAPGDAGQLTGIHFDDGKVGEFIDTDDLSAKNPAIVERDLDLGGSVDDVAVGDDVSVGGDDDPAADAVLDLRLLRHAALTAEELRESGWEALGLIVGAGDLLLSLGGHGDVDDGGGDAGGDRLHGLVERGKSGDTVIVKRSGAEGSGGMDASMADEDGGSENEGSDDGCGDGEPLCY